MLGFCKGGGFNSRGRGGKAKSGRKAWFLFKEAKANLPQGTQRGRFQTAPQGKTRIQGETVLDLGY